MERVSSKGNYDLVVFLFPSIFFPFWVMLNNVGELRKDSFGLDNDGLVYSRKKPSDSLHPRYRKQVSRLDLTCHKFFLNSKSEQREKERERNLSRSGWEYRNKRNSKNLVDCTNLYCHYRLSLLVVSASNSKFNLKLHMTKESENSNCSLVCKQRVFGAVEKRYRAWW